MSTPYRLYASRFSFWAAIAGVILVETFLHHVTRNYEHVALIAAPFVALLTAISTGCLVYAIYNGHIRGPGRKPIVELNDEGIAHRGHLVARWSEIDAFDLVERHQGWQGVQHMLRIRVRRNLVSEVELKVTCLEGADPARYDLLLEAVKRLRAAEDRERAALKAEIEVAA